MHPTKISESISDKILPGQEKILLRLALKDGSKGFILNLLNVFYLSNNLYNLLSLELFNNNSIYYNNKNKTF